MDAKELADILNGREYGHEMTADIVELARESGLVIVYGASDDLMEFDGAIFDEVGCFDGGTAYLDSNGLIENKCDHDDCPYYLKSLESAATIKAVWCVTKEYCWTYETDIPHATFDITDEDLGAEGTKYCRGIVFSMDDLRKLAGEKVV